MTNRPNQLYEAFLEEAVAGTPPPIALSHALERAAYKLALAVHAGGDVEDVLADLGVESPHQTAQRVVAAASALEIGAADQPPETFAGAVYIILVGGNTKGIPTPQCVQQHLPRGRKPTVEEIKKAWNACRT